MDSVSVMSLPTCEKVLPSEAWYNCSTVPSPLQLAESNST